MPQLLDGFESTTIWRDELLLHPICKQILDTVRVVHFVVVHVNCRLASDLAQEFINEYAESLCIVAAIKDLVVHKPHLLANGPDDCY